jgi:monoamine oxidase
MTATGKPAVPTRRTLLETIGLAGGSAVLYQAMTALGHAQESSFRAPPDFAGRPSNASIVILGAGLAGLVAAYELKRAGWQVRLLEFQDRPGGRNWTVRGGDRVEELGGFTQNVAFDQGQYFNPGPWRIPHHHHAVMHYCRKLGVALEPFVQVNHNAFLHNPRAFDGKPQRFREVQADFHGSIAELLAKAARAGALDQEVTSADRDILLAALRGWGALDADYAYRESLLTARRRGYAKPPGGGADAAPRASQPLARDALLRSGLWGSLAIGMLSDFQMTMFQPVGGMDRIGRAFAADLGPAITLNAQVMEIRQDSSGVAITWRDRASGRVEVARAGWCLCTLPLTVLGQMETLQVGNAMRAGIDALPYDAAAKVGLQFKRRFWEEDEAIFGGISYTAQSISQISYPANGMNQGGKGVLLAAYPYGGPAAFALSGMSPAERIERALEEGSRVHPQYRAEFETGFSVGWHRVPWILGCAATWTDDLRRQHYAALAAIDGRVALAGDHVSYLPAWQEGAVESGLDAAHRLHRRALGG